MDRYRQQFSVSFDYPVYFGTDVFAPANLSLVEAVTRKEPARRHRLAFVVERRIAELWPLLTSDIERYVAAHEERLALAAPPRIVQGSESAKNDPREYEALVGWFHELGMDRQAVVVVVGGGALQDMAGYAAAITHRGLRTIRVPTTVLSQDDSGVGVKNGVNAYGKKNFLGTFTPPFAVLNDFRFLSTLDPRDKAAGMAEAVKVALIKDAEFFSFLEGNAERLARFDQEAVAHLIRRCATLHLQHIAGGDPFELGSSRPLDFGHWAAHKLESLTGYALRHGEAVAIGMALDTRYSVESGLLAPVCADRVVALLQALRLPTYHEALQLRHEGGRRVLLDGIQEFREHLGGELTLMMLADIGQGREIDAVDEPAMERAIEWLRTRWSEPREAAVLAPNGREPRTHAAEVPAAGE